MAMLYNRTWLLLRRSDPESRNLRCVAKRYYFHTYTVTRGASTGTAERLSGELVTLAAPRLRQIRGSVRLFCIRLPNTRQLFPRSLANKKLDTADLRGKASLY